MQLQMEVDSCQNSFDLTTPAMNGLPEFLAGTRYINPSEPNSTAFKVGHKTDLTLFEYLGNHPESALQFNHYMEGYRNGRATWTDPNCVHVEEMLGNYASKDDGAVLLVEVGGCAGRDIVEFQRRFPNLSGRLVLQDLPSVINLTGSLPAEVEAMPHDFFAPQPIHGTFFSILISYPSYYLVKLILLRNARLLHALSSPRLG